MIAKNRIIVVLFAGWSFALLALLLLSKSLGLDLFFSLAFIGFLMVIALTGPFTVRPAWRTRISIIIAIGAMIFLAIVVWKIYAIGAQWSVLPGAI